MGDGSGVTAAHTGLLRLRALLATRSGRLLAASASILDDSPRRLGASKMSKMGKSIVDGSSSSGRAMAAVLIERRLTALSDTLRPSACCDATRICRTVEEEAAIFVGGRRGGSGMQGETRNRRAVWGNYLCSTSAQLPVQAWLGLVLPAAEDARQLCPIFFHRFRTRNVFGVGAGIHVPWASLRTKAISLF